MKIREKGGAVIDVFAVYFVDNEPIFYGLPKNQGGLIAYKSSEVSVVENHMVGRYVLFKRGIYHWALIEEELLDDLSEHDKDAYKRFLEIAKKENLLEENFF